MGYVALIGDKIFTVNTTNYSEYYRDLTTASKHHYVTDYGIFMPSSWDSISLIEWMKHGTDCLVMGPNEILSGMLFRTINKNSEDDVSLSVSTIHAISSNQTGNRLPSIKVACVTKTIGLKDDSREYVCSSKDEEDVLKAFFYLKHKEDFAIKTLLLGGGLANNLMQPKFKTEYTMGDIKNYLNGKELADMTTIGKGCLK